MKIKGILYFVALYKILNKPSNFCKKLNVNIRFYFIF